MIAMISSIAADDSQPAKILLVWHKYDHPPGTHMYQDVCLMLARELEKTPGVKTVLSDGWPTDPAVLEGVTAIVMYTSPGGTILLDPKSRESVLKLLKDGAGLTAIHWGTGASPETGEEYLKLLGGWFHRPLFSDILTTTAPLIQIDPAHPICRGWKGYDLKDEFYLKLRYMPESKPLLKVRIEDQEHIVAWTYVRPQSKDGRSFGIVLGHFFDNFQNEAFRKLMVNGILWSVRRES
jgi:type 1 glutamine amidotransferase